MEENTRRVCKGSMNLGSGCGECKRCVEEIAQSAKPSEKINDIMEATEAKRIAESYNKKVDNDNLEAINRVIHIEANKGKLYCYFNVKPSEQLYNRLEGFGYDLEELDDQRDGYSLIIKWG